MLTIDFNKYPAIVFVIKLLTIFLLLYFFTQFWIGICAPGGYYIEFCNKYLNYVQWIRESILNSAAFIVKILGYKIDYTTTNIIHLNNGISVKMVYSCVGIGLLCCWAAFSTAFPALLPKKIKWLFGGLFVIWFINVVRVAILVALATKNSDVNKFANHHTIFNGLAYLIIVFMFFLYTKNEESAN
jgi:exosortase/archaeosortase family protein